MAGGFPLIKWWTFQLVLTDDALSARARLVYPRLLKYHNQTTGQCNPTEERLGLDLGCSDRTVRAAVSELEKAGYIDKENGGGRHVSNQYTPTLIGGKDAYQNAEKKAVPTCTRLWFQPLSTPAIVTTSTLSASVLSLSMISRSLKPFSARCRTSSACRTPSSS